MNKTKDIPKGQRKWVYVNLSGSRFHNVDISGSKIRGALLVDVELDGYIRNLTINGVDVGPLVERELDRLYPERAKLKGLDTPEKWAVAWATIETAWKKTVARARKLPPEKLYERVDGEWSFVETLRHLVFALDAWISRPVLGAKGHFWPGGLANTDAPPWVSQSTGLDPKAKPSFDEALAAHKERLKLVRDLIAGLTPQELARRCKKNSEGGYPADTSKVDVITCLRIALTEEWEHHRFAVRDLAQLKSS